MLAVNDPQNPANVDAICVRSWELYPILSSEVIESLSGLPVPIRTRRTLQEASPGANRATVWRLQRKSNSSRQRSASDGHSFEWLQEGSVDPNDLRAALPAAVLGCRRNTAGIDRSVGIEERGRVVSGCKLEHENILAGMFVNCCGAWAGK